MVVGWSLRVPVLFADRLAGVVRPCWVSPHGLVTDTAMAVVRAISAQIRVVSIDRGSRIPLRLVSPAAASTVLMRSLVMIQWWRRSPQGRWAASTNPVPRVVAADEVSIAAPSGAGMAVCAAVRAIEAVFMPSHRAAAVICAVSTVMRSPRGSVALMMCLA